MVLAALWPARSPNLRAPSNNPPGVKLLPSCRSTLATHYCLPGGTCSLFGVPPLTMLYVLLWCSGLFALHSLSPLLALLRLLHCIALLLPPIAPIAYHLALSWLDPTPTKRCFVVTPSTATMSTMPCLATTPFSAMPPCSATTPYSATTPRSATTPYSVTTTRSATTPYSAMTPHSAKTPYSATMPRSAKMPCWQ
jgi:hypothetical protein